MATITTRAQQAKVGDAADRVGGYDKLIQLSAQKRAATRKGEAVEIGKDKKTGEWKLVPARKHARQRGQILGKIAIGRKVAAVK